MHRQISSNYLSHRMSNGTISISIIIVNYNGKHFLKKCLDAVLAQCDQTTEVIVVDNASKDGSAEYIKTSFAAVRLVENAINRGFAGGNNDGVRAARGSLIILLNNDTVVHPGWLEGLRAEMNDLRVVSASSLIKTEGIPEKYYEKNGSVNFLGHNIMRVFDEPSDIFYAGGASMIFRKELIGLPFDDDYFVYGEDVYLGLRSRFMGYQVKHTNASVLDHFGSGTAKKEQSEFLTFYQERNRILNTVLFFSGTTLIKVLPFLLVNTVGKTAAAIAGLKYSLLGLLKAYFWIISNIPAIRRKRRGLQKEKIVPDSEVIRYMTGKLTNGESTIGRAVNAIAILYCRIVRLTVIEILR
jgi:GT2 family glycosyltransferase